MRNEPEGLTFKNKIRQRSSPTVELGGLIWAYMGPPELEPPLPKFAWTQSPATHRHVSKVIEECNWLQALEGGIDTSHAPILHRLITTNSKRSGISPANPFVRGKAPALVVDLTDWGYQYAGIRPLDKADMHIRTYHFVMPLHQLRPYQTSKGFPAVAGHIWVPMDDGNTMVYNWHHSTTEEPLNDDDRGERRSGNGPDHVDQTTFRSKANRQNNYLLDRRGQKKEKFTPVGGGNTPHPGSQENKGGGVGRREENPPAAGPATIHAPPPLLPALH